MTPAMIFRSILAGLVPDDPVIRAASLIVAGALALLWAALMANKNKLRLFSVGVTVAEFNAAKERGDEIHEELRKVHEEIWRAISLLGSELRLSISTLATNQAVNRADINNMVNNLKKCEDSVTAMERRRR